MSEQVRDGWFVRTASRVGDLGSPFYEEEHQRDVWNEASAIGFQLLLLVLPAAAVVSVWVGGAPAVPYALVMFFAVGGASWVVTLYSRARGVDVYAARGVTAARWRTVVFLGLLALLGAGVVRALADASDSFARGLSQGVAVGAVLGGALGVVAVVRAQRRARVTAGARSSSPGRR